MSKQKEKKEVKLGFTTIMHEPRLKFNLSLNEYCIADAVYHLSHNPSGAILGWCYASRSTLGGFFGISRQTVSTLVGKLEDKGLLDVHEETDHLRTTKNWYENFVMYKLKKGIGKV